jgi:cytochrome c biogenesis protein CcdA
MTISAVSTNGTILDSITLTPRSGEGQISDRVEAAARRLAKQMIIAPEPNLPEIELIFFSSDCSYCRKLLNSELPRVAKKYRVAMKVSYYDLGVDGTYDLFLNAGQEFGKQGADVPAIFIGRTVLGGEKEITGRLGDEIADFCRNSAAYHSREIKPFQKIHDTATIKENAFNTLTYSIVLGAGLLDGINPCAFTTVIFLISYLGLVGGTRKQMLYTGGMFTLAVFIAYFAIGILFFSLVKMIIRQHVFSVVINSLLLAFVLFLAVFSFIDFIRCLRGRVSDITLQLPKFLRDRIHARIRDFARNKLAVGGASFLLGIVIAGMELTCTGQVYFPIITMISEPKYRVAATTYLFSYNVAFILPLVVVFLLATFGITSQKMGNFFKDKVPAVKLGLCILFLAIGALVAFNLGILR